MSEPLQPPDATRKIISVVISVYNESANIEALHRALDDATHKHDDLDWEFILVDDGSGDDTFSRLSQIRKRDPRLKVVQLSRNYGAHTATAAGLQFASGDAVIHMSGDLQDPPHIMKRLIEEWRAGFHVVWGIRLNRQDNLIDGLLSRMSAILIQRIALPNYPAAGVGGIWLIDRLVVDAMNAFPERNRVVGGLILFSGFRQTKVEYAWERRHSGKSKWSLRRKIGLVIDIIAAFSMLPIRVVSLSGVVIAVLAFGYMIYEICSRLIYGTEAPGFTQLIVVMLMLGGLQLALLGMLGEYLWRALDNVRARPLFFVQTLCGDFPRYFPPLPPIQERGLPSNAAAQNPTLPQTGTV
jgi:polyisoprenyl-phosphate glycosyltransferase